MTYAETLDFLAGLGKTGSIPGLTNIRHLLAFLGDPQDRLKFIHIAGTNGKGSVLAYVSTILSRAGYRTGRYLSPAVNEYRERFAIDGQMIPPATLTAYVEKVRAAMGQMAAAGLGVPTVFEFETALAFLYFKEQDCAAVVLETGMGGALDATNIVTTTVLEIFTPISRDHMQFLGNTLTEIAGQKAGIMKPGTRAVSAVQAPAAAAVLQARADELTVPLEFVRPADLSEITYGLQAQQFSYRGMAQLQIALAGRYQVANAALAISAVLALRDCGFAVPAAAIRSGLKETRWPGRFAVIAERPLWILDGAHNPAAAAALADSIKFYFTNKRIIYIMGVLRDKEYEQVVQETVGLAAEIITLTPHDPRGLAAEQLSAVIRAYTPQVTTAETVPAAAARASALAGPDDVVIAFGSLSYLGELSRYINKQGKECVHD